MRPCLSSELMYGPASETVWAQIAKGRAATRSMMDLADHCISNLIVQTLRDAKYEVFRLRDLLPVDSSDAVVIAKAQEVNAIVLSLNGHFADIVTYPPRNYGGLLRFRCATIRPTMKHYRGKLLVVEVN